MKPTIPTLTLSTRLFRAGMRVIVACSGGADSVALLRTLLGQREDMGLVLSVAHMHHGIRGEEADADAAFVARLAARFDLPLHDRRVDVPAIAQAGRQGLEETARALRYAWFRELLAGGEADAVVTAHTLDDQAETVLHRMLRGAWTEGLGGIFPVLEADAKNLPGKPEALILRPFLSTTRGEIETYLRAIEQPWREDATNRDATYTRNRIRHELLPKLAEYNPGVRRQLAHLATLARDEESYWQAELNRLLPSLLLAGKPVRGGGRATDTVRAGESLAVEIERLRMLAPALRRRVLRAAAGRLRVALDFDGTERLLELCGFGEAVNRQPGSRDQGRDRSGIHLENGLRAVRTPRELQLFREEPRAAANKPVKAMTEYRFTIPGSVDVPELGLHLEAKLGRPGETALPDACLRAGRPGDRVTLRHSRSRLKVKEALQRAHLPVDPNCPVLEWQGEIVWMPGVAVESGVARTFVLTITSVPAASDTTSIPSDL